MLVTKSRLAREDILESAKFIADDNPEAGIRFLDAVDETLQLIKTTPLIGRVKLIGKEKNIRMWFVKGFSKHIIFYTYSRQEIRIIRVIHSARDYKKQVSDD